MISKRLVLAAFVSLGWVSAGATASLAQDRTAKIGVLSDQSGPYQDSTGLGSVAAAELAVEDSGLRARGWKIDVLSADHQNKADIGANIARKWIDTQDVDVIADGNASSVALAVTQLTRDKNRVFINSGAATSELTNEQCTPNTIHWAYDTYMVGSGTGSAITKAGGDSWFFLTADNAFGTALERETSAAAKANGGSVLGSVRHPFNSSDFSSYLLQAQASKAKVIGLSNAGSDPINAIKQAAEFGIIDGGQKLAGLLLFISDIHSLGLKSAQGIVLTESFYWDMNDGTRAFARRFQQKMKNKQMPTMVQAGVYSGVLHYLRALEALGGNPRDGAAVVAKMKDMPTNDPLFGKGLIQPNGRKIHPAYLFEVKKPSESKEAWDYYKHVATIPAEQAFTPLDKSSCPLLKK